MKSNLILLVLAAAVAAMGCSTDSENTEENTPDMTSAYYPPIGSDDWETVSVTELGWNEEALQPLLDYVASKDTKAFLILKNGRIAVEWYGQDFTKDTPWYWASAGKTLTAFTTGIAKEEGFLQVTAKTSTYLGDGWTSIPKEKEDLILVRHQLTMTTGLDDTRGDCKTPDCLVYIADAGTRWGYHNAPYTLLQDVIANATNTDFESYYNTKLRNRIGMTGQWLSTNGSNNVYWSNARSMARFGLLNLHDGVWEDTTILGDADFMEEMKNSSQELNKSYGYLWWLNGKESAMVPKSQVVFNRKLIPSAPDDLYAGLGKNDQKLYLVPGQDLVIVRMGEETGIATLGPSSFDDELWGFINNVIN
ncbi:serine hydrolase domain-containing protein [Maribacter chungangensis]|uniref:Serine hydrolase domain-containing protein n=1 Tax=Maribacter chungangensis TaxID=1069117 RepID=A0ABW3B594_9FLAO